MSKARPQDLTVVPVVKDERIRRVVRAIIEALVAERKQQGLSQREVARRAGVKQPGLSMAESGVRGVSLEMALRILEALGCGLPEIYLKARPRWLGSAEDMQARK